MKCILVSYAGFWMLEPDLWLTSVISDNIFVSLPPAGTHSVDSNPSQRCLKMNGLILKYLGLFDGKALYKSQAIVLLLSGLPI